LVNVTTLSQAWHHRSQRRGGRQQAADVAPAEGSGNGEEATVFASKEAQTAVGGAARSATLAKWAGVKAKESAAKAVEATNSRGMCVFVMVCVFFDGVLADLTC
jgi:hypothetical protein